MTNKKSVVEQAHIDGICMIQDWLTNAEMAGNKVIAEAYRRMRDSAIERYQEMFPYQSE